MLDLFGQTSA